MSTSATRFLISVSTLSQKRGALTTIAGPDPEDVALAVQQSFPPPLPERRIGPDQRHQMSDSRPAFGEVGWWSVARLVLRE